MPTNTLGLGQGPKLGMNTQPRSPTQVVWTKILSHHLLLPCACLNRKLKSAVELGSQHRSSETRYSFPNSVVTAPYPKLSIATVTNYH